MVAVAERSPFLADQADFVASQPTASAALAALREAGRAQFEALGFPTIRDEAWRKTNVKRIAKGTFARRPGLGSLSRERLEPFLMPDTVELVFVNGALVPELTRGLEHVPEGVAVRGLADALADDADRVLAHLARHAPIDTHPFAALNQAFLDDGAFVHVPRGVRVKTPIHLLFLGTSDGQPTVSYPRNLFVADTSSEVTIIETYAGFGDETLFTCPVTEIVAADNAIIDHYKIQQESLGASHMAMQQSVQGRDSNVFSHSISHGGALVRNDIRALLDATGISCTLNGLYLGRGNQHVDHHMYVDHAKPNCNSYELYKGVLEEQARAVFNGTINVRQDAQKTDAKQSNRNLLLSPDALVSSNPQLTIFADDVRCTHGSTTGHLEDDAIFYLRSRGIGKEAARSLLTYAFAAEVLQEIRLARVREDLEAFLFTRLPKGDVVRQAV